MSLPPSDPDPDTKFDPFDPERLRAYNQPGFSRVYQLDATVATMAVEASAVTLSFGDPTAPVPLKLRVQANLIRLFQLALLFDDCFPSDPAEEPSDRLMAVIEALWSVGEVPAAAADAAAAVLGPVAMRAVLDYWYGRHLVWWKANRRSKKCVRAGRELVLVTLMDEYRRSRRYGVSRRDRQTEAAGGASAQSCVRTDGGEVHPRYLASRAVQWLQIVSHCPDLMYARVLPCPPAVVDFLCDKEAVFSENLLNSILRDQYDQCPEQIRTELKDPDLDWMTIGHGPTLTDRFLRRDPGSRVDSRVESDDLSMNTNSTDDGYQDAAQETDWADENDHGQDEGYGPGQVLKWSMAVEESTPDSTLEEWDCSWEAADDSKNEVPMPTSGYDMEGTSGDDEEDDALEGDEEQVSSPDPCSEDDEYSPEDGDEDAEWAW